VRHCGAIKHVRQIGRACWHGKSPSGPLGMIGMSAWEVLGGVSGRQVGMQTKFNSIVTAQRTGKSVCHVGLVLNHSWSSNMIRHVGMASRQAVYQADCHFGMSMQQVVNASRQALKGIYGDKLQRSGRGWFAHPDGKSGHQLSNSTPYSSSQVLASRDVTRLIALESNMALLIV
jgi:hypothetical protein